MTQAAQNSEEVYLKGYDPQLTRRLLVYMKPYTGRLLIALEKHYISGAGGPRCKVMICMVKTGEENAPPHLQQSQILVPLPCEGVEIVQGQQVFGDPDAPHGHMHIVFDNVRVPASNMLLGEGRGFEISQLRLGPGRIHHCMRLIGAAERALEMMCKRVARAFSFR